MGKPSVPSSSSFSDQASFSACGVHLSAMYPSSGSSIRRTRTTSPSMLTSLSFTFFELRTYTAGPATTWSWFPRPHFTSCRATHPSRVSRLNSLAVFCSPQDPSCQFKMCDGMSASGSLNQAAPTPPKNVPSGHSQYPDGVNDTAAYKSRPKMTRSRRWSDGREHAAATPSTAPCTSSLPSGRPHAAEPQSHRRDRRRRRPAEAPWIGRVVNHRHSRPARQGSRRSHVRPPAHESWATPTSRSPDGRYRQRFFP